MTPIVLEKQLKNVEEPANVCHCLRLRTMAPHQKTRPQPQAVPCCERTAAFLGVVVRLRLE